MSYFGRPPIKMGGYIFSAANFRSQDSREAENWATDESPIEGPTNKRRRMESELLVCQAEIKELKNVLKERDDEIAQLKLACQGQARVFGAGGSNKVDFFPKSSEQAVTNANASEGSLDANKDKVQQRQPKPNDNQTTSV